MTLELDADDSLQSLHMVLLYCLVAFTTYDFLCRTRAITAYGTHLLVTFTTYDFLCRTRAITAYGTLVTFRLFLRTPSTSRYLEAL